MGSLHPSARPVSGFDLHQTKWTPSEKAIARKVYDEALQRELAAITQEAKRRAATLQTPAELWELEDYLTESRKKINQKYDYRYSVLPLVFAQLVREGYIRIEELRGISEDKLAYVRMVAEFRAREAAE